MIQDDFIQIVAQASTTLETAINYMWGHPLEIVNRLKQMTSDPKNKDKKFPLVALFTDYPIQRNLPFGRYGTARMNLVIATLTKPDYTAPQREAINFVPILRPIEKAILRIVERHPHYAFTGQMQYTSIERFFWGKQGLYGTEANVFGDYLDAIEIQDLQLVIRTESCFTNTKNF